ncbi:MAG: glycosyl hydrolase [Acidobacteriia bacterium]|nr:glycosyl hydrolase [Terriglobia bacterium]
MKSSSLRVLRAALTLIVCTLIVGGSARVVVGQRTAAFDPTLFGGLHWRGIGPANTGGRIDDFAIARMAGVPDAIYVAAASGGVFKSTNQGTSWTAVFDRVDAMMSIGAIAVAPSNPNVVWAGTGEANNRQSSSWGDGVYKSTDAGRTWRAMGLRDTRHIGRVIVHPENPDIAYVAAVGHLWGSNSERGVFKTIDGGATWTKSLFVDDNTGATDLVIDPRNPDTLYAAMYQRQRKAWGFNGGGPGSGIYRTRDGGATWTRLTKGLPSSDKGRIGLDIYRADPRVVFAVVEASNRESGVYRTTDGGDSWDKLAPLNPRPMYFSQIRVDPKDRNHVYLLGSNRGFYISDDGGRTFRDVFSTVHSEDHALWIDPDDPNHLLVGGDGGVSISWDRGATWLFRDNLPVGQFYEISADNADPYVICGGLQDNGHWCVPSATRNRNGISNHDGFNIGSGDGFYTRVDPTDARTVVVESQDGRANRVNVTTLERQAIAPLTRRGTGLPAGQRGDPSPADRWNWNTPIAMSAFDPKVLYIGSNIVFRSADRGVTWKAISPDLTANVNRETLEMMGGPVSEDALSRHDGQTSFSTLTTIGESPLDAKLIYTGSDDGQISVTRDGGQKWTNLTSRVPALPPNMYVSSVLPSRHAAGRVYATFDGHYQDDYRAYVYVSEDYGQTWRSITAGLPETSVHKLREHPRNVKLLFVGHERGIHVSIDGGTNWSPLTLNMPAVPVDDIIIHPRENDLIAGTHGRGLWILDNIGPLEALTAQSMASEAFLVPPARARLLSIYNPQAWYGAGQYFAPNPDFGGIVDYYLRDGAADDAQIAFADSSGTTLRTIRGPVRRGLNRVSWDLRMEPPTPDRESPAAGGFGGAPQGPLVLPGTYTVTVRAGGRELKGQLRVESDPRVSMTDADRRARQSVLLSLYDLQKTLGSARAAARAAIGELDALGRGRSVVDEGMEGRLAQAQTEIAAHLGTATSLSRAIEGYSGLPTADQRRQLDWAFDDVSRIVAALNRVLTDLPSKPTPIAAPARRTSTQLPR